MPGPIKPPPDWKIERVLTALSQTIDWAFGFFGLQPDFLDVDCSTVKVGVLDTGVDLHHPDLKITKALDFTGSLNGAADNVDHGTWCAGYIAAQNNDIGVRGIASGVQLFCLKVLGDDGSGTEESINAGLQAAIDLKLDVISLSLGGPQMSDRNRQLFAEYVNRGGFPFAAAGNDGNSHDEDYPARWQEVAGVAAVDKDGRLTSFSCYGPGVVCCAPGFQMLSTIPGGYGLMSGTSMACPAAAGVACKILAAILNSGQPRPTAPELFTLIEKFARLANGLRIIDPEGLLHEVAKAPSPPVTLPSINGLALMLCQAAAQIAKTELHRPAVAGDRIGIK